MSENVEIEQLRAKYHKIVDRFFKEYMHSVEECLRWANNNKRTALAIDKIFKEIITDTKDVTVDDLRLFCDFNVLSSLQSWRTTLNMNRIMKELREITYLLVDIPFGIIQDSLPRIAEQLDAKIEDWERKLEDVKKEKMEIELEVSENIEKEIQEWFKERERVKKVEKTTKLRLE